MKTILSVLTLLGLSLCSQGCFFYYKETSVAGSMTLFTAANIGFVTDQIAESNSRSGGIPLLTGGYQNDTLTETTVAPDAGLVVGSLAISGPIDNGTPLDNTGQWIWRTVRTVVTGQVFKEALGGYFSTEKAKAAADASVKQSEISAGVSQAEIAADVQKAEIASEISQAEIAAEAAEAVQP